VGLFDSNKKTTNTTQTVNTTESNQQSGSLNLAKGSTALGDITISNGVIEANEEMRKFGEAAFDYAGDVSGDAFGFGNDAIEANGKVLSEGLGFAESLVNQQTANSNNATLAMKELANNLATGGAGDVAKVTEKTVYVVGAVVVVVLVVLMFKGR
jgi:hypothetical protein